MEALLGCVETEICPLQLYETTFSTRELRKKKGLKGDTNLRLVTGNCPSKKIKAEQNKKKGKEKEKKKNRKRKEKERGKANKNKKKTGEKKRTRVMPPTTHFSKRQTCLPV